jgi:hypothetical protein
MCLNARLDQSDEKKRYCEVRVLTEMAGTIAQDLSDPERVHDMADAEDARWARELVQDMVSWQDHEAYLNEAREKVAAMVKQHWPWIAAVALALLGKQTLTGAEVVALRASR